MICKVLINQKFYKQMFRCLVFLLTKETFMKSVRVIFTILFLSFLSFSAYSQTVKVKLIVFLDRNGDCQKQITEPTYYLFENKVFMKNSMGTIDSSKFFHSDTWAFDLNRSSNYSIRFRDLFKIYKKTNCSNADNFYPFSIGLNDTSIFIPIKDSLQNVSVSRDLKVFSICKNDSVDLYYTCYKSSGLIKTIVKWGDGLIDTFEEKIPGDQFKIRVKHKYSAAGVKLIFTETYGNSWNFWSRDTLQLMVENCKDITGKVFTDANSNCIFNSEPILKSKIVSLSDTFNQAVNYTMTDNSGNYSINVKDGSYRISVGFSKLNCKSGSANGDDYLNVVVAGANITKDLPVKDSFYTTKLYMEPTKLFLCDGDTLVLSTNILASSNYHTIIDYGNGKRDTFLNDLPRQVKHIYQSTTTGSKKIVAKIYTTGWILKDSVVNTIVLNQCNKKLSGKVYVDYNPNCLYNGLIDPSVPYYTIVVKDSSNLIRKIAFTDFNGNYSFDYDTNQSIKVYVKDIIGCNGGKNFYSIAANSPASGVRDFPLSRDSLDVSMYLIPRGIVFPGDSLKLSLMHNSLVPFSFMANYRSFIPNKSSVTRANNANSFSFTGSNAYVQYATNNIGNYLVYNFSTATQSGDTFCFNARLARVNNELDTSNNETTWCIQARNSYDPNDKQVAIRSIQKNGDFTDRNDALVYTVRFQNTGTAPARNIYILDSLTHKLDLNTFQFLTSSHQASLSVNENRMLRLDFKNINLPDSASNPLGSQGYFIYSIKPKSNLDTGELIENVANIFFDFNPPITTNTTKNRFVRKSKNDFDWTSGVKDNNIPEKLFIYPNPVTNTLNFSLETRKKFTILNPIGQEVMSGFCSEKLDVSQLSKGMYYIDFIIENNEFHFKFIKE
jgi:uncharacterized repeat protein (TIGR01451 family)